MLRKNILQGANVYSCPPPAIVWGKSRPSALPGKSIKQFRYIGGLFATFSPQGGGAFPPCEGFFYCYVFPLLGAFFTMWGSLLLRFSILGGLSAIFSPWGVFFSYYKGHFLGFPPPYKSATKLFEDVHALLLSPLRAPKPPPPPLLGARHPPLWAPMHMHTCMYLLISIIIQLVTV